MGQVVLDGEEINDVGFERSSWNNVELLGCRVHNLEMRFCELAVCNLANTEFDNLFWQHSGMKNSKATGVSMAEAIIDGGEFNDCKLDLANFKFARITNSVFYNCELKNADFQSANFKNVKFISCNLSEVNFSQADFKDIDLRHSILTNARIDVDNFKEITISPEQVIFIANSFGISVKD